jgi:hypothetical protein
LYLARPPAFRPAIQRTDDTFWRHSGQLGLKGLQQGASYDEFRSSLLAGQTYTATYMVDATTGRAADGAGNVQFTSDASGSKGLQPNVTTTGTYSVDVTGRAPVTVSGDTTPRIFYVVSPRKAALLSGDTGDYVVSLEQ